MDVRLSAAWLSRHEPSEQQLMALAGYVVVFIDPEVRSMNPRDSWNMCCTSVGRKPDLVITMLADGGLKNFVKLAHGLSGGKCEVVRPVYNHILRDKWEGKWKRAVWYAEGDEIVMIDWFPRPIVVLPQDAPDVYRPNFKPAPINQMRIR